MSQIGTVTVVNIRCQPLYVILDKPERGLNVQNTGMSLEACLRCVLAGFSLKKSATPLHEVKLRERWFRNNSLQQHIEKNTYEKFEL